VFLIALALLLALVLWQRFLKEAPSYSLVSPPPVSVVRGTAQTITLQANRFGVEEPIRLSFSGLPPGIEMEDATIPSGAENVQVRVKVAPDAKGGKVRVQATVGENEQVAMLEVTAGSLAYALPEGWVKGPEAHLEEIAGKFYYDKIEVVRGENRVPFLLMPARKDPALATFYIMEDKVWVGLFEEFAEKSRKTLANQDWKDGKIVPSNDENKRYPVMGVVVDDAYACAVWLGGKLPLPRQWDRAAGRFDRKKPYDEGPYIAPWDGDNEKIAVNRGNKRPKECGTAVLDKSIFGCRDMAGNGLEWTRRLVSPKLDEVKEELPLKAPDPTLSIVLRGCRYWGEERPLRFDELDIPLRGPGSEPYRNDTANPQIGFRVVLEP
jgi:hypothetical protein